MPVAGSLLSLLLAVFPAPLPDILPPGSKRVRHELVLEPGADLGGWRLVATPVRGFQGVEVIELGRPFTFSSKYGTRIYALAPGRPVPAEFDPEALAALPSAAPPVQEIACVSVGSPLERVLTRCRVVAIGEGVLRLEVAGEERFDAGGNALTGTGRVAGLLAIALAGLAGLAVLYRRRPSLAPATA